MAFHSDTAAGISASDWFRELGYNVLRGPDMLPDKHGLRQSFADAAWVPAVRGALRRLNQGFSDQVIDTAVCRLTRPVGRTLLDRNEDFHRMLVGGVDVQSRAGSASSTTHRLRVLDFSSPERNTWSVVRWFRIRGKHAAHRWDFAVFVNGLPLALIDLGSSEILGGPIESGWECIEARKADFSALLAMNEFLVLSNGVNARIGTLSDDIRSFRPWRAIGSEDRAPVSYTALESIVLGVFPKRRLLNLMRNFVVFERMGGRRVKTLAADHHFQGAEIATQETLRATGERGSTPSPTEDDEFLASDWRWSGKSGDRRVGIVWQVGGSGLTRTLAYFIRRIRCESLLSTPTVIVVSTNSDLLDEAAALLNGWESSAPAYVIRTAGYENLRGHLAGSRACVLFSTLHPRDKAWVRKDVLSDRNDIVLIAFEPVRTRYRVSYSYSQRLRVNLPNASFACFTKSPFVTWRIAERGEYGGCIHKYDFSAAIRDQATVPLFYECRSTKLGLPEGDRPVICHDVMKAAEHEDDPHQVWPDEAWKSLVRSIASKRRMEALALDIVEHSEQRMGILRGKALVVCVDKTVCHRLYTHIVQLRPDWRYSDGRYGRCAAALGEYALGSRGKAQRDNGERVYRLLAERFRDESDPLQIVILRRSQLAYFESPSVHTVYLDRPMTGHRLAQALGAANQPWGDKPGSLVVDYLGTGSLLRRMEVDYVAGDGRGQIIRDNSLAEERLKTDFTACRDLLRGVNRQRMHQSTSHAPAQQLAEALDRILSQGGGKRRFIQAERALRKSYALATPCKSAAKVRSRVAFFARVSSALASEDYSFVGIGGSIVPSGQEARQRSASAEHLGKEAVDSAKRPSDTLLSEQFLSSLAKCKWTHLAIDSASSALRRECAARARTNLALVRACLHSVRSARARYRRENRRPETVCRDLVQIARRFVSARKHRLALGLSEEDFAFYQALDPHEGTSDPERVENLCRISAALTAMLRDTTEPEWPFRETDRWNVRRGIARTLKMHRYSGPTEDETARAILDQAEILEAAMVGYRGAGEAR